MEDVCLPVLCRVQVLITSCLVIGSYYVALAGTLSTFTTAGVIPGIPDHLVEVQFVSLFSLKMIFFFSVLLSVGTSICCSSLK